MKIGVLKYCLAALALVPAGPLPAVADIYSSRPTPMEIRWATLECARGRTPPAKGVLGISDPHAEDPGVIGLIEESGARWVRAEFRWSEIQSSPSGKYDWRKYDDMVDAYNKAGVRIAAILTYIPQPMPSEWAQIDAEFRRFAKAVVKRYAPRGIHYWEVFNEPNLPGYGWLQKGMRAEEFLGAYTLLLATANRVVRANDPAGVVILGGLASDNHGGVPAEDAMDAIYGAGARDCFDVFAFHPYGYQNKFPAARDRVNAILAAGDDTGKAVWFNEYGWTDFASMDMKVNGNSGNNPMMAVFKQRRSADAFFWFSARDYSTRWGTPSFGLADFYLNKRPSFWTFQYLAERQN